MAPVVDGLEQRYGDGVEFQVYGELDSDPQGSDLARSHGVQGVPTMMLVDSAGVELRRWIGPAGHDELAEALDGALGD